MGTNVPTPVGGGSGGGTADIVASAVSVTNLSLTGAATVDGVVLATGQTCFASAQTDATTNGPYTVNTAGAWTRSTAFAAAAQMIPGLAVRVLGGSLYAGSFWVFTTTGTITVGTTALTFVEVPGAGALAGLTLAQARLTLAPEYFAQVTGANVQTLTLAGLNGNVDGDYALLLEIVNGHAGAGFNMFPSFGATSCFGSTTVASVGTGTSNAATFWGLSGGAGLNGNAHMVGTITTLAGLPRVISLTGININGGTTNASATYGVSTDTTTNLTQIAITSTQADGLAAGTFLRAVALGRS